MDPTTWATEQFALADEYMEQFDRNQDRGQDREVVEEAIEYCQSTLEVFTNEAFPDKWADVRRENLEDAVLVRCFEACKEVRPDEKLPDVKKHWAKCAEARKAASISKNE
jgi:hypothetical protein